MELFGTILNIAFYGGAIIAIVWAAITTYRHPERYIGLIDYTLIGGVVVTLGSMVYDSYFLPLVAGSLLIGLSVAVKRRIKRGEPWSRRPTRAKAS
jgi:hypothetical protein